MHPNALTSGFVAIAILIVSPSTSVGPAVGSLVVLVRAQGGLLLAADSRVNDSFTGSVRDGVPKLFASATCAWFLTGKSGAIAYDADTRRERTRVDLYDVLGAVAARENGGNALAMATRMASQVAWTLTGFYAKHRVPAGEPLSEFAVIGVIRRSDEMALARIRVGRDGRSFEYELVPVERVPRLGVFGNDRVYTAMKRGDPRVARLARDPLFRKVRESERDPSQAEAMTFARWLIEVTSQNDHVFGRSDHPVGGSLSVLFLAEKGNLWLARPNQ